MSIFAHHLSQRSQRMDDVNPVDEPTVDVAADPLDTVVEPEDAFAEQRARRNEELGLENLDQSADLTQEDEPVDGLDEDMSVDETDSDVEVAEGEYGIEFTSEEDQAEDDELDVVEGEHADIERLENDMLMLDGAYVAVETYGINPTAMGLLSTFGLLNGTALESMGLEDLGFRAGHEAESQLALESLGVKIKEKAAEWGAKIMSFAKNAGSKVLDVLGGIWTKVSTAAQSLASASWEKAKEAGRTVKAHPVKSLMIAAAAVAAVAGVVALVGSSTPAVGSSIEVVKKFSASIVAKIKAIKWPFGKAPTATVNATTGAPQLLLPNYAPSASKALVAVKEPVAKLGWTKNAVNTVLSTFNRAWSALKDAWGAVSTRVVKLATSGTNAVTGAAKNLGSKVAGGAKKAGAFVGSQAEKAAVGAAAHTVGVSRHLQAGNLKYAAIHAWKLSGIIGVVSLIFKLTRTIVVGAFRMVLSTFGALKAEAA